MSATSPAPFADAAGGPDPLLHALAKVQSIERVGRVAEAYGTLIRATGLKASIGELCELRDNLEDFEAAGVTLLGISCDSVFAQKAWSEQEGFEFDLLSDFWPHGDVARAYGVLDEANGLALRGSFLVDADGIVRWSVVNPRGQRRDLDGYRRALEQL